MQKILGKIVLWMLVISTLVVIIGDSSFAQKYEFDTSSVKGPKCSSSYEFTIHKLHKLYKDLLNDGKKFLKGIDMYSEDEVSQLYQYVYFGNNSTESPMKWRVLATTANDYENTKGLFMVAEQAICLKDMKDMYDIKDVLNKKVLREYFTEAEQDVILETSNVDNLEEEKLFLLSEKEVTSRQYGFWQGENRTALRTLKIVDEAKEGYNAEWWLRDVKNRGNKKVRSMVGEFGEITQRTYGEGAIRVALNIPFSNIVCTHDAGEVNYGKKIGGKLNKINLGGVNEFKLTIVDDSRSNFRCNQDKITTNIGDVIEFDYMNATPKVSDNEEYISVSIRDKNGREFYYGKLANVDMSGNGTVCMEVPNDIKCGEYILIVMNERENGVKQTNYAGYDTVKLVIEKMAS